MAKNTEAQNRAKAKYNKARTKTYCLRLNLNTDQDIINRLESPVYIGGSKNGYIKQLIRNDIQRDNYPEERRYAIPKKY